MARVSQRWLQPEVEDKIYQLLLECVTESKDKQSAGNFIDVLLTKTEKLMIGKRIAIALMLIKGHTPPEIDEKLKVTQTTVYTVKTWLEEKGKEYWKLLKKISDRDDIDEKEHRRRLDEARGGILPPPPGTNWKEYKHRQWQKARDIKPVF